MEIASDNLKCAKYIGEIVLIDDNGIITNKKEIKKFTLLLDIQAASDELQTLIEQHVPQNLNLPTAYVLIGIVCTTDIEWGFYVHEFKKWILELVEPTVPRPRRTRPTVHAVEEAGVPPNFERMMEENLEFELPPWPETMPVDTHQLVEPEPVPQLEAMETEFDFDDGGEIPELYFAPPEEVLPPPQDFQDEEPFEVPSVLVPEVQEAPLADRTRVHDDRVPLLAAEQRAAIITVPPLAVIPRRGGPRSRREGPERLEDASAFHEDYHQIKELENLEIDDPWFDNIFPAFRVVQLSENIDANGDQVISESSLEAVSPSIQRPADSVYITHIHEAQQMTAVSTEAVPHALPDLTVPEYTAPHGNIFAEVPEGNILSVDNDEAEDENQRTGVRYDWIKSLSDKYIGRELRIEDITPLPHTKENIVETFMCLSKLSHERIIEISIYPDRYLKSIRFI